MTFLTTLWQTYQDIAFIIFNIIIILIIGNLGIWIITKVKSRFFNPVYNKYPNNNYNKVYPDLEENSIKQLLKETWSRPCIYEPFTQFKERPFSGNYVNVDKQGFRITKNQGSWPPQPDKLNIFLFGGGTTFGYGVKDDQTIASYLQEILENEVNHAVRIYNFARGYYYSTQERILLEHLLISGFTPHIALFIHGLNEFYYRYHNDRPFYTSRFEQVTSDRRNENLLKNFPINRLLISGKNIVGRSYNRKQRNYNNKTKYKNKHLIDKSINRYLNNKRIIDTVTTTFSTFPVFVW